MPRRPFFAFAVAATTLLVVGVGSARADAGAPESGATAVIEPPADQGQTTPTATGGAAAQTAAGGTTVVSGGSVTGATATGATTGEGTQQPPAQTTVPPATQPAGTSGAGSPTTGEIAPAGTQPTQTPATQTSATQTSATLAQQAPAEPVRPAPTPDASLPAPRESSFVQAPQTPPPTSGAPPAAPARPAPTAAAGPGTILEQLVPSVDRRLRTVQADIVHMRRELADGATPPSRDLAQLRLKLHLIAPALLALETRIGAAGPLSPDLRNLLDGVHGRLADTRASAAALAAALRRSGVDTPEAQLLLRELEAFSASGADGLTLAAPTPATPWTAFDTARVYASPSPVGPGPASPSPAPSPAPSDGFHAAGTSGGEAGTSVQGQPPADRAPAASSAGSASAGSGGGFSAAGVAALAALLFGLALPQLLSRLQLPTIRAYAAGFLTPLEQPG